MTQVTSRVTEFKSNFTEILVMEVIINERSEFFCSLSDKSERERPGPARGDAFERLISPRLWIRFPYGLEKGIGPFKLP